MMDVEGMADKIEQGERFTATEDGHFGKDLAARLGKSSGWKPICSLSRCKVSSFEAHLEKGSREVEIIESNLFGDFTMVNSR